MLWQVMGVVCVVGSVASLFMRGLSLSHTVDATWAIKPSDKDEDPEVAQMKG